MIKSRQGFTLTELMIAIVLLGIIAGFGIPSYNKAREKALEREAVHNLRMIVEALKLYYVRNDNTYPDANDVNAINAALNLGIIEGGNADHMRYICSVAGPPNEVLCVATRIISGGGSTWSILIQLNSNDLISFVCLAGPPDACPSCPFLGCPYPETF